MTLPIPQTIPNPEPTISRLFLTPVSASFPVTSSIPVTSSAPPPLPPIPQEILIGLDLGSLATDFSSSLEPSSSAAADAQLALAAMKASASVSATGDNGVMPMMPKFDIKALLGSGSSALTTAAAMKLASAITNYVTAYVDAQVSPLQMQITSLASAAKQAPATTLSIVPGKLKALKATVNSSQAKIEALNNARQAVPPALANAQQIAVSRVADARTSARNASTAATNAAQAAATKAQESAADAAVAARTTVPSPTSSPVGPLAIQQNQKQQIVQQGLDRFWDNAAFTTTGGGQTFSYTGKPIGIAQTEQWDVHPEFIDVGKDSTVRNDLNQRYVETGGNAWPEYKTAIENRLTPLLAAYHSQVLRQQAVTAGTLS